MRRISELNFNNTVLTYKYDKTNQFYEEASKIEPYFKVFKLFSIKDEDIIKLCIASIRVLAVNTQGYFTRIEAIKELSFMEIDLAKKIFNYLEKYEWIVNNGVNYELPDKIRYFAMFVISALSSRDENYDQMLAVPLLMSELDEVLDSSEEISISNIKVLIGALGKVKSELKSVLEQKNTDSARIALRKSGNVRTQIDNIQKVIKRKNKKKYQYIITNMVQSICAEIINLHQDLLSFIHDDIQANSKAFGKYLTPEQIAEFLHKCPIEKMALLSEKNFSSPHQVMLITKAELEKRGGDYLTRKIEFQEATQPPPVAEIVKRRVIVSKNDSDVNKFYEELFFNKETDYEIPIKDLVVKETYGKSLYRAGLLIILKQDIKLLDESKDILVTNNGGTETLPNGPVRKITSGIVNIKIGNKEIR
ncbi:MAG: hypothetical protein AB6733_08225 [Clostridiaceae bacterium]